MKPYTDPDLVALARELYGDDDIEIDDDAAVSRSEDQTGEVGAWVAAWVWIPFQTGDNA